MTRAACAGIFMMVVLPAPNVAQEAPPILDMHLHAMGANDQGPAPLGICAPFPQFPAWDQRQPYTQVLIGLFKQPPCSNPVWSPAVLVRHPALRVYVMHAGYPLLDDMLAVLYAHPQVYVEVGVVVFSRPRADFYQYLEALVIAGFGDRIMFGSDQMVWPGVIERSIETINQAPFLSQTQKRAILYDNAARFLRLSQAQQDHHWGR